MKRQYKKEIGSIRLEVVMLSFAGRYIDTQSYRSLNIGMAFDF
ncbi:MAG TPA: hypothetical protein VIU12_32485 [Chryseolinea sp.]